MITVDITQLIPSKRQYKELSEFKHDRLLYSLQRWGQLKPILVSKIHQDIFEDQLPGEYNIIKGNELFNCMRKLDIKTVWIHEMKELEELEEIHLRETLDITPREIDVLLYADVVADLDKRYGLTHVAEALKKKYGELVILNDLLNLKLIVKQKSDNSQFKMELQ